MALALLAAAALVAAVSAQSPTPAPFLEWQVSTEYTNTATGKLTAGRVGLLMHRATGSCWIVYPGQSGGIAPAPKEVCAK